MQLMTEEIKKTLPQLYSTEQEKDPIARVKFFTPWTNWTWYATELGCRPDCCKNMLLGRRLPDRV